MVLMGLWDLRIVALLLNMCIDGQLLLRLFDCNDSLQTFIASMMLINDASRILFLLALNMILITSFLQFLLLACLMTMNHLMIVDFIFYSNLICFSLHVILYGFCYFVILVNFIILSISWGLHKIVENYI